ncbi:PREDICTED: 1-phosphatidylinositol 4,5-bisphosphate phosphodiesterase eta-1 isoform X1 [Thamnophis sirtalis]|uniref:Phosphoinositide phospholipase C n=1 Tax=Thamnophis sirtalis TaxID=35019 RepID=A0A6I9WZU0_9SAUR|nr:PREDICTED: 1-phosphatidylinositol 4,5-bisphosphate phosphodiesterase eta-1 isoform X1 [Thamnophis sirtalis]
MSYWNLEKRNCLQYCRHFLVDNSVFHVERCMSVMQSGTQMIKLKHGAKGLVRLFYLDEHRTCIRWRPSRKSEKAKIIIDSIYKVTEGRQSEIFHRHAEGNFDPSCCFTIYHGNHMESLDLITSNSEEARTWITGLKYLMAGISDEDSLAKRQRTHDHWVKQTFQEADKNGDGLLNIEEIHQLMHKLNVNLPRRKVRQMFQEADTDENQGTLNFEEFSVFYKMMSLRRDLYLLLLSYSDKKDHLTVEDFTQFLKIEQKMNNVTTEYCLDIIRKFEVSEENKNQNVLGIEGFTNFMCSPACDVFNPLHSEVHQDMEQPLCNYFIASSHNTYLTGDQLLSQSKVEMYARVLQDGCRCLEVDCWDGPDGEPVVHHGYTLTSKIPFKDVIDVINKNAFTKNEFPIILSIENHCNVEQQKKIAQYLKEIFGDKLDLTSVNIGDLKQLPSPQSLKGKILVKGKKLPYSLGADAEEGEVSDEDSADEIEDDCKLNFSYSNGTTDHQIESFIRKKLESLLKESQIRDKEDTDSFTVRALLKATHEGLNVNFKPHSGLKDKKSHNKLMGTFGKHKKAAKSKSKSHCGSDDEDSQQNVSGKESGQLYSRLARRRKTMKLCRDLSDLVVYTNSVAAQDIIDDGSVGNVLSFSETRAHQVIQQKSEQFLLYNQQQLTRVYPSAYRIDSSNFNPVPYWNVGCQLVALNYQSEGRMMQLNQAKFRMNGNCGYILKPQQMCKGTFNPYSGDPLPAFPKKQLILKIISGQQLPKPPDSMLGDRGEQIIDPFVEVEIIGLPADCCKDQTRVVDDNGFNPVWEETLTFTIHMPEIALVRFLVWDHDPIGRDFVGQRTVAFSSLMPGYRHVYLEGLTEASIFVHVTINEIFGKWSPLILNPSYTIMHFLGATKNKQLIGLRGLFNRNSKHNSVENSTNYIRKRSLGDRILRRTASAPAKARKKNKMCFQETTDLKESVSDMLDLKEKEGGFRQTSRSLQLRPISMPVGKYLLAGLPPPDQDASRVVEVIKSESTSAESRNDASLDCTNAKKTITSSEKNPPFTYLLKKDVAKSGTCDTLCPDEKGESLNFAIGIAETYFSTEYWKSNLPNEFVHVKEDLERKKQEDIGRMDRKTLEKTELCKERRKIADEKANMESLPILTTTITNVCSFNGTPAIPDSDISCLINEVSLAGERERDNSISKLIEQVDVTSDQTDLTLVSSPSDINKEKNNLKSLHLAPCTSLDEPSIILDDKSLNLKSAGSACSTGPRTENTIISTPKTTGCSVYTIIHEASLSPVSQSAFTDRSVCKDTAKDAEDSCLNQGAKHTSCISPIPMQKANPKKKCGTSWEFLGNSNSYTSDIQNTIVVPVTCANSTGSSLMEIDGELQDLLITAFEYKIEDMSQVASPLKLKHSQDTLYYNKTICEPPKSMDFPSENLAEDLKFNNDKNQYFPYPRQQRFELLYNNCLQISDAQNELLNIPQSASINAALKPQNVLPSPFPGAQKQQSPCKSKSLGDLTSEDISCNFESKYKYISRGFITSGMRDNMVATLKAKKPSTTDILTEQLRKLVSFEQEESCQSFCSKQNDDCPKMLVRKLSSRSQSRVRNIASRAKERQEANKQKPSNVSSNVTDIVLRNKPPVPPHIINRHSTGSYIASYLDNFNTDELERRGVPEGACSSLHLGYSDRFCTDDSLLETKPNENDKPEIYFLLRL